MTVMIPTPRAPQACRPLSVDRTRNRCLLISILADMSAALLCVRVCHLFALVLLVPATGCYIYIYISIYNGCEVCATAVSPDEDSERARAPVSATQRSIYQ